MEETQEPEKCSITNFEKKTAKSTDDIRYATAQAKVSEDDALRIGYKAGTPLEGGKIADSEPVDLFSSAHNISRAQQQPKHQDRRTAQDQLPPSADQSQRDPKNAQVAMSDFKTQQH
nr:uncharacterized protein LOC113688628 [Coffea arabica]XP_027065137.1 uncharacterized protein LOC113691126 [Coffea arabica]